VPLASCVEGFNHKLRGVVLWCGIVLVVLLVLLQYCHSNGAVRIYLCVCVSDCLNQGSNIIMCHIMLLQA